MAEHSSMQPPEFHGDVAKYRDWKRAVLVQHAAATDEKRQLTAPRVLASLKGDAHQATRHLDPEVLRGQGEDGLQNLLKLLDKAYEWQPESLLYEAFGDIPLLPDAAQSGEHHGVPGKVPHCALAVCADRQ